MATSPPERIEFVDHPERLPTALALVDEPVVGVDVERADSDRYHRAAALVQVGVAHRCVLVDAIAIDELTELDGFLTGKCVVVHAAENDLGPLESSGVVPVALEDTAVAAALLGRPTGLVALLADVLGVELDGDKDRLQRADWTARPLTDEMAAYAASDVVHLPRLWAELDALLAATGRKEWYRQELAATVERAADDRRAWERTRGSGRLDAAARAILRALWEERERIASTDDIAPQLLLHDSVLVEFASRPPRTAADLVRRVSRRRALVRRYADRLMAAVEAGRTAPPEPRGGNGLRTTDEDRARYDALRRARAGVARDIGIDAGVLCPSRPLLNAVAGDPEDGWELCALAGLRPWQAALLAEPLWEAYSASDRAGEGTRG